MVNDSGRRVGNASKRFNDSTSGSDGTTKGIGEVNVGLLGEAMNGLGDAANKLDGIKEGVQCWRDKARRGRSRW